MIKQARFILIDLMSEFALRTHLAACFYSTAILKKTFLTGVSMAIIGGWGEIDSRLSPPVNLGEKYAQDVKKRSLLLTL